MIQWSQQTLLRSRRYIQSHLRNKGWTFFPDKSDQRNILSHQPWCFCLELRLKDNHKSKGGESHPLVGAMESAVRLIPAVTLALLLKEEGDDEEEEESSLAWEALQSRNPFRPRLNVRRSSRPFSVGEEESSEETTRLSSFDKVEAEPPSIREFSKPSRRVRIEQRDWFRWRFDCEGEDEMRDGLNSKQSLRL